nr:hypothetical protein [uncultured Lachnoclostridium sp.]
MQYVSSEYKEAMKQAARNKSYMRVSLGLINQAAQTAAEVSGGLTYFSDLIKPLSSVSVSKVYATFENDFAKVDGSMYFLPREGSGKSFYNSGITTEELCGQGGQPAVLIEFNTADPVDIKGLTLEFGDAYPVKFTVQTDEGEFEYENGSSSFKTEDTFNNTTFMRIAPTDMKNGIARFRIYNITFGIGITFENEKIVSAELKSTLSPISESLPSIDFSVTIENMDRYYNVDNDDSAINYMETGQEMQVYYGYALNDGEIEWVKGGTLYMQEWSADDKTAKFEAADVFEYMQDEYKRGEYRPNGITLFDLAVDVFEDAGMSEDKYWVDPYLKNITVYNPLPMVKHKECLQLIANAGRSVVIQNRDGLLLIKSSFEPEKTVSANQVAEYGNVECLLSDEPYSEYTAFEKDYARVDGQQYFMPRSSNYIQVGYVSASISGEDGAFEEIPLITLTMESAYTFHNLTLLFGSIQPVEFVITTYNNGKKLKSFLSKSITEKTIVFYDFIDTDKITIEFTKAKPHNRIHLKRIEFGAQTDYEITYDELTATPNGTKLEKVKELRVIRTIYTKGTELKDLTADEITLAAGVEEEFEIDFGNAVHDLSAVCVVDDAEQDFGAKITDSSSYWCKVRITKPPKTAKKVVLTVRGYEYSISTAQAVTKLNNTGSIQTWNNPLISSAEDAANLVEWVGAYYKGGNQYDLKYRGDPILDCNDLAYLESRYVEDLMIRLEEVSLKFSGSLSGTLVARRKV